MSSITNFFKDWGNIHKTSAEKMEIKHTKQ